MPSWLTQLLALLPVIIADAPSVIAAVTKFIDDLISGFQTPAGASGIDQGQAIAALKKVRSECVALAAKSGHKP